MIKFVKTILFRFFDHQSMVYLSAGLFLMIAHPEGTFLHARGKLCLAIGRVFRNIAMELQMSNIGIFGLPVIVSDNLPDIGDISFGDPLIE